ncbi:uncharacterized protein LOC144916047 [Branchiostoma floridae x Branchiostoma belcheri]
MYTTCISTLYAVCFMYVCSAWSIPTRHARTTTKQFSVSIDEDGTHFIQTVEVDDEENVILFHVPSHNRVSANQVLLDYKTNQQIIRYRDGHVCLITSMPTTIPSVKDLLRGLQMIKESRSMVTRRERHDNFYRVAPEPVRDRTGFSGAMEHFCGDSSVFRMVAIPKPFVTTNMSQAQEKNETSIGVTMVERTDIETFFCEEEGKEFGWTCAEQTEDCIYVYDCETRILDSPVHGPTKYHYCTVTHQFTGAGWQCVPSCILFE